ncbi:arf-GAP with coiled-coil, ANK repeat and PH domain-containing protein 2-like [Chiloscyllium punctatum]|uniref:arf-GAP with coiled-coil, ANK repeat and PH domain-containing protein 2-like n=1 Tax=Chiloscyllium punctatum TaxID=137246 RepID=UPI003B63DDAD
MTKPTAESSRQQKQRWIEAKYVQKRFVKKIPTAEDRIPVSSDTLCPSRRLYSAAAIGDLPEMCEALAHGAYVNWTNSEESQCSPLISAARGGSVTACEYLLLNGAHISYRDATGQGPIHVATRAGQTGAVCVLLKRGANQYAVDERGQDPLSIAVATANADIVTLLRMARMNQEMREAEGVFSHTGDDPTFQDIFQDFSRMASDDPEKLRRGHV